MCSRPIQTHKKKITPFFHFIVFFFLFSFLLPKRIWPTSSLPSLQTLYSSFLSSMNHFLFSSNPISSSLRLPPSFPSGFGSAERRRRRRRRRSRLGGSQWVSLLRFLLLQFSVSIDYEILRGIESDFHTWRILTCLNSWFDVRKCVAWM